MKQGVLNPTSVQQEISHLEKLSCSPPIASQVLKYLENEEVSVTHLAGLISSDSVLTARVLKLANSENLGYSGQISTLNLAIITIGLPSLVDLLRGISAVDQFSLDGHYQEIILQNMQRHNLRVGTCAKNLSKMSGYPLSGEAFIAGLLHDLGYQVLYQVYPDQFSELYKRSMRSGSDLHSLEKKFLGIDHCQAGSWLARAWNLPEKLISAIEFHHDPGKISAYSDIVNIIFFSNLFSHVYKQSDFENTRDEIMDIYENIQDSYGLENLTPQILQEIAEIDDVHKRKEFKFSESLSKYN